MCEQRAALADNSVGRPAASSAAVAGLRPPPIDAMAAEPPPWVWRVPLLTTVGALVLCTFSDALLQLIMAWFAYSTPLFGVWFALRWASEPVPPALSGEGHEYVFIIPSYNEPVKVLRATLFRLASHAAARHYTVCLAFEAREMARDEPGEGAQKRDRLLREYAKRFRRVVATSHELLPHEQPGKASNVGAALAALPGLLAAASAHPAERTLVTVLDADNLVDELYVRHAARLALPSKLVVYPIVVYGGDVGASELLARGLDHIQMITWAQTQAVRPDGFPLSSYSMRLDVLLQGGVDPTPIGIGEDIVTTCRAFLRAGARSAAVCRPLTVSRTNTTHERVVQTIRHATGLGYLGKAWHDLWRRPSAAAAFVVLRLTEPCLALGVIPFAGLIAEPSPFQAAWQVGCFLLNYAVVIATHEHFAPPAGAPPWARARLLRAFLLEIAISPFALLAWTALHWWAMLRLAALGSRAITYRPAAKNGIGFVPNTPPATPTKNGPSSPPVSPMALPTKNGVAGAPLVAGANGALPAALLAERAPAAKKQL